MHASPTPPSSHAVTHTQVERMIVKGKSVQAKGLEIYGQHCITVLNMPCQIEKYLLEDHFGVRLPPSLFFALLMGAVPLHRLCSTGLRYIAWGGYE